MSAVVWWALGDHKDVKAYKPRKRSPDEICGQCGQALSAHGSLGGKLVHPGDIIDKGKVTHPDPMGDALAAMAPVEE